MNKNSINIATDKINNILTLTLKCTTVQTLITLLDKLKINNINKFPVSLNQNIPSYTPYLISSSIIETIKSIKPDINKIQISKYTKTLSIATGIITGLIVSSRYDGINYFISLSLNILKSTATTFIIDKLDKLKTIDGISISILLNFIFSIPKIIIGLSTGSLVSTLLTFASIGLLFTYNYRILKSTEDIDIHYKGKVDKLSFSGRNTYTTSLVISSLLSNLVADNLLINSGLMFIINPLIQWLLSRNSIDVDELNRNLQVNELYIDNLKHGKETKDKIHEMIRTNSLKLGIAGAIIFITSNILIHIFAIEVSAITLTVVINSFMNVQYGIKSFVKGRRLDCILKSAL
jgi:hypothetical protein